MSTKNKRGRPTKNRQLVIHKKMIECFEDDLSAPAAARKAKIDVKTAYDYYDEIIEQRKERNYKNLFERQEKERIQIIATLDKDIIETTILLEEIRNDKKKYLDSGKPIPNYLIVQELNLMKFRFAIKDRKAGYLVMPTPEEAYNKKKEEISDGETR
ncbi:MAG: hypothetical protein HZA82_02195 [Thaumarchaeota archaeon]|nr:hypothetical protein [Nitrososphaerota archaeon]